MYVVGLDGVDGMGGLTDGGMVGLLTGSCMYGWRMAEWLGG